MDAKKNKKGKLVPGISSATSAKRTSAQAKPSLEEIALAGTSVGEVMQQAQGVILVYCALAALIAALWSLLYEQITPPQQGSVWVRMCGEVSNATNMSVGLEVPSSLKMKLLAVYLAEDINITTMEPIYGASRYTTADPVTGQAPLRPRGGKAEGLISKAQNARRVWTHPACDIDGDGITSDCDISARWKYPKVVSTSIDLGVQPNMFNPSKHRVPAGNYSYVVLQTCLENLESEPLYSVRGAQMRVDHSWGGANVSRGWPSKCFHLTKPFARPLRLEYGDEVIVTLSYSLLGSFRSVPFGDELRSDWECFAPADDPERRHCARLPAITPSVHRQGDKLYDGEVVPERFSLSMMPPDMLCHDWRYLQAIGCFQLADDDGTNTLIYGDEFKNLFESLALIGVGSDPSREELDTNGDLRVSFSEFTDWLARIGIPRDRD